MMPKAKAQTSDTLCVAAPSCDEKTVIEGNAVDARLLKESVEPGKYASGDTVGCAPLLNEPPVEKLPSRVPLVLEELLVLDWVLPGLSNSGKPSSMQGVQVGSSWLLEATLVMEISRPGVPLGAICDDFEAMEASDVKIGCSHSSQSTVEVIEGPDTGVVKTKSVDVITPVEMDSLGLAVDDVFR